MIRDLTSGNTMRQLLVFSYPLILSNLLQQAYNMADMVIVGQFVGSAGLAATANAGMMAELIMFLCNGMSSAGQIIISQHIGAGSRDRINTTIGTLLSFLFLYGVGLTVLSVALCDTVLVWLKVPAEAMSYAHDYALVCFLGTLPICGYNAISAILRGMGDSKRPMIFIGIASALNVVLDLIFVGPLHMGCFGAALATVIGQGVSFVTAMAYLYRHRVSFGFDFKLASFRIDRVELKNILTMGCPLALQMASVVVSILFVNSFINKFGVVAAAATAVGNKLGLIATILNSAMNVAGASIIAQNFAARKLDRVTRTLRDIIVVASGYCALLCALLLIFPEQIFSVFDKNPAVISLARLYAPVGAVNFFGQFTRGVSMALINGVGHSRLAFIAGLVDGIFARISLSLLFGVVLGWGLTGFWWGSTLAGFSFAVFAASLYFSGRWKTCKLLVENH